MKIDVAQSTLNDQKWYPILDVILLLVEEQRHGLAVESLDRVLGSEWVRDRPRADRDLIRLTAIRRSHDNLVDKSIISIDADCPKGGRIDESTSSVSLHPSDGVLLLAQPFNVIVEDEWFDGAFLLWMARALNFDRIVEAYRLGRFQFRHAGGKNSLVRSATIFSRGIWPRTDGRVRVIKRMWVCVVFDNDGRFPGDAPNLKILKDLKA